ncbi:MAG TPA: squalene/phytoene synthase family protein [Solirubrobacteraceae bacterium]|nr:squalene/phytoene synthase family protein [Solirubrobacteraceae bacterium]
MSSATAIDAAYARCERITREQAANFYFGIRLLSGERRRAMCAVYAFARLIDDIGDGSLPTERKLAELAAQERALEALARGEADPGDPVMTALADALTRFPLPLDALQALIDGVRMDVEGTTYETFEQLVPYCRRVAGAVGRVCLAIFGLRADRSGELERAYELADDLGVALQLTNILRDVREDAGGGRIYLPAEDLRRFGLPESPAGLLAALPTAGVAGVAGVAPVAGSTLAGGPAGAGGPASMPRPAAGGVVAQGVDIDALVAFEAARAREWFARGMELVPMLDRRSAACVLAMAGIYRRLLERIDASPRAAMSERMSLPAREKAWVAARGLLGAGA